MRILQALFFPPEQPGGVSSMIPYLLDEFNTRGCEMEIFSLPKRLRGKGHENVQFTTFDAYKFVGNAIVDKYMQTLKDYIWWSRMRLKQPYDLIHAHHPIAVLALREIYPDTPIVMTIHSAFEKELLLNGRITENGPEHQFLTSLYGELEAKTNQLLTVSNAFKGYLADYVQDSEKIGVIPNGFDEKRFRPMRHENAVPQLITMCRLVPAKGLDTLIYACAELKKRGSKFVLHIIGDGPNREELEKLAIEQGIYDDTIFYGYMLHPEDFMPFFDIFVLPSRAESFGSVYAEAALCLLALVGTNVGGVPEQIEHERNGLLVQPDDPKALCLALEKLILDPVLREKLAHAAWDKARKTYALSRVTRQLQSVYDTYKIQ
ncbi:glycosyltransferase family 1 protein [Paenibacillus albiflavus]|uniref:Glycosyltransferase family 1 protein n=1 Tax=Paenibacillus albiflavus TaxID=2545760 RepID=A0A4R4E865_9BACL|nr:glycosyltransferase family 4 protein [Paenibacillus albiflavus]TCZ74291.1 glycosyltransferase family 1 protein [Paenibacillus albiflavus]